jgi:hypothetical protein
LPYVQIEAEKAGDYWVGKVVGQRGTREFWRPQNLTTDAAFLEFLATALAEVGTPLPARPPEPPLPPPQSPARRPRHAQRQADPPPAVEPVPPVNVDPPAYDPFAHAVSRKRAQKMREEADRVAEMSDPTLAERREIMAGRKFPLTAA